LLAVRLRKLRSNAEPDKFGANQASARNRHGNGPARIAALVAQAFSSRP
jgi:hypothetical protein